MSILIIGSGFAGLCMGIRLKEAGIHDFTILERNDAIGGTWLVNNYPGCACDVQSHLYSFSFEPNPGWSRMFAPQAEIRAYLERVADKYGIRAHVKLNQKAVEARWSDDAREWTVRTERGDTFRGAVLVGAIGGLSNPAYPKIAGMERFKGEKFHSALWNHDYDLTGKKVAVIGTGASAIQFVPQIAKKVAKLSLFQRTPPWIMKKPDRPITGFERFLFKHVPATQRFYRRAIYWACEARVLAIVKNPKHMEFAKVMALRYLHEEIKDRELRKKLTPDYAVGCKRILLSDDYYPALARENVDVVTDAIQEVREHSVVTADGKEHPVDAIIFGTGFTAQSPIPKGLVIGRDGADLYETWGNAAEAYKGSTVHGYPNFFFVVGPNTGLGHSSMVYMIESVTNYVVDAIKKMRAESWSSLEVKPEPQADYNAKLQQKIEGTVWQVGGCKSWYMNDEGRNTALWPDYTFRFREETKSFDVAAYAIETKAEALTAGEGAQPQVEPVQPARLTA